MSDLSENKREMFDGMRAYHESEISHANHAITMLLALAGGTGAVVLALLFPQSAPHHVPEIALGLIATVTLFAVAIAWSTHAKIDADHQRYAEFGAEYVRTCELLGFYTNSLKTSKTIGQGNGYRKTQTIIWTFAGLLVALTLVFASALPVMEPASFAPAQFEHARKCQARGGVWMHEQCVVPVE